jgi:glycosyltransferase involved in cell wall biosynthesis
MPIIEAFFAGAPVITSLGTAAPEVAGDAALLVDPTQTEEITNAMLRLANDAELVQALRMKGFERAQKFTWQHAASKIAEKLVSLTHA